MKKRTYRLLCVLAGTVLLVTGALTGCSSSGRSGVSKGDGTQQTEENGAEEKKAPKIDGLKYQKTMQLKYATGFDVYYYKGGYKLLDVHDDRQYLIVPEGKKKPADLDKDIVVLKQPLDHIYLAATSAMALFDSMDGLESIRMSGAQASDWYIDNAKKAMEEGRILFAGKYSEPDYEMLVDEDCDLAIESTMILHTPKVQEMIEDLDIPVLIDYASYESHPLGRTEWVKLYGALFNKEKEAENFFSEQAKIIEDLEGFENTEKTVAYFYINTDGTVVVRKSDDYIPAMIEIAGGRYAFSDLKNPDNNAPSVKLTMEEFYATAVDADYLIYNGTIVGQVSSIKELEAKNNLFSEFKAVKNGNVWYTGKNLYQSTDTVGELIRDIHLMLTEENPQDMTFLQKME